MNEMATPTFDLENELRGLTTWHGPAPDLWKAALAADRWRNAGRAGTRWHRVALWAIGGIAAMLAIGVIGVWTLSGRPTRSDYGGPFAAGYRGEVERHHGAGGDFVVRAERIMTLGAPLAAIQEVPPASSGRASFDYLEQETGFVADQAGEAEGADRQVVRKATIELVTKDVRAAFLKAAHLISAAQDEFVQESSLTGTEPHLQGSLVLRVAVPRLSEVLNELRQLGTVQAETSSGEDVTTQVVDLEARLRNEQRVEAELLQLLDKRQDAPLKEIIELHSQLSQVRQTIEQYVAQRERLSRLVSLATVLVLIRSDDAPPPRMGLSSYFSGALADAWYAAVRLLVDTLAVLVRLLLGGAIWWLILLAIVLAVRAHLRHRRRSV